MARNTLTDASIGRTLRYRGLNVATGKHIRLDAFIVVAFGCLCVCLSLFRFVQEGKDKLRHVGIMQNMTRLVGQ